MDRCHAPHPCICDACLVEDERRLLAKAQSSIAALEQMVRELVEEGDYLVKFAQTTSGREGWQDTRTKALALLQPEAGKICPPKQ